MVCSWFWSLGRAWKGSSSTPCNANTSPSFSPFARELTRNYKGMDILIHASEISAVMTESWNLAGSLSVSPLVGITTVPIYGFRLPMTVSGDSTTTFLPESMANTSQKVSTDQAESRLRREKKNTAVKAREEMLWIFGGIETNQPYNVLNLDPSADQGATGQLGSQWSISPTSHCYLSLNICASLLLSLHFSF